MKNNFFDELFYIREQELNSSYTAQRLEVFKNSNYDEYRKDLLDILSKNIKDKNELSKAEKLLEKFETAILDEDTFNTKYFYQLGFKDGIELKQNIDDFS